jgi:hypothetical protein
MNLQEATEILSQWNVKKFPTAAVQRELGLHFFLLAYDPRTRDLIKRAIQIRDPGVRFYDDEKKS